MLLKKTNILFNLSKFLLVLLFAYAGSSKLIGHALFLKVLMQIEMIKMIAEPISFLLPALEILVAILITIEKMQITGLWLATFLMTTFTFYVVAMFILKSSLPCICGEVISSMSWKQHLLFNIFFMLLSWSALLYYYNRGNKIISTNKKEVS